MAPPDGSKRPAIGEFAKLSLADKRAIIRHLSREEREVLERLLSAVDSKEPQAKPKPARSKAGPYSPRLTQHLQRLLDARNSTAKSRTTAHTRKVLEGLLATPPDHSTPPDHA